MSLSLNATMQGFLYAGRLFRFEAINYSFPDLRSRLFSCTPESQVIEKYWTVLQKKGSAPNIEKALGKIKVRIVSPYVEKVLYMCVGNKMLGFKFFIWAGQQPGCRYHHSIF